MNRDIDQDNDQTHDHTRNPHPVQKPDEQWREQLSDVEYQVTRHAATERPFTGRYWDHWDRGIYDCVCCGTPLFESDTKFDAGVTSGIVQPDHEGLDHVRVFGMRGRQRPVLLGGKAATEDV